MKVVVLSLGGSLLIPAKVDFGFLNNFRNILRKHYHDTRFVIVCGGGNVARQYITALSKRGGINQKELSMAGIRATRMNAMFLMQFFGKEANDRLPLTMEDVKNNLKKNNVVICGGLRYVPRSTSDGTAARLAKLFDTIFINLTNVEGLYTSNPLKNKNAKFIPFINWNDFNKMANKSKFKPGQHFVLDQRAAKVIKDEKIPTYIIGKDLKNLTIL